ncbi:MAG: nucleoside triphosphate pyrophosphohydrolase [Alteromonas sp.]|jgi:ATP diphosphatase|uniref:nucleoside triphosphate pyrophosphohydrolase n=1 Tax=Alteromonas sp. TaxID=232 RepID=UPI0032D8D264
MQDASKANLPGVARLLSIMDALRSDDGGCPWDQQQTMESLTRFTIEEAYEVVDAIAGGDIDDIRDELGDLLFQIVFYAHIAQEDGQFDFDDVATAISDKLVRRHPHVFAQEQASVKNCAKTSQSAFSQEGLSQEGLSQEDLAQQWEAIKAQEKAERKAAKQANTDSSQPHRVNNESLLDSVPKGMPALMYAQKLQKKCAKVGFDWPDTLPVLDKVEEELEEIKQELNASPRNQDAIEEEIGDALFAMVNLARHCNIDADTALRKASIKFAKRFTAVEELAHAQHDSLTDLSLDEMESLWVKVKAKEKL